MKRAEISVPLRLWHPEGDDHRAARHRPSVVFDKNDEVMVSMDGDPVLFWSRGPAGIRMASRVRYFRLFDIPKIPWFGLKRTNGTTYHACTFGTTPSLPVYNRYGVSPAAITTEHRTVSMHMHDLVEDCWQQLKERCPELAEAFAAPEQAQEAWRIRDTPYTSGVVNRNVHMPYHRDRGNVAETGSVMRVIQDGTHGGMLHLPQMQLCIPCPDGALLAFYGEKFWHGVTPIYRKRATAMRYSIVAYAKQAIRNAADPETELRNAQLQATRAGMHRRDTVLREDKSND